MNISRIRTTCIRNQLKMLQNVQIWTIWILERGAYFIYSLYERAWYLWTKLKSQRIFHPISRFSNHNQISGG